MPLNVDSEEDGSENKTKVFLKRLFKIWEGSQATLFRPRRLAQQGDGAKTLTHSS